jgi:hypothetical protein
MDRYSRFNKHNTTIGRSPLKYGFTHFAKHDFQPGETVLKSSGMLVDHQTRHISIQIGVGKHFLPKYWTGRNYNHSCDPNCYVRTRKDGFPDLIAKRGIRAGEEITFAYWMTEYEWTENAAENRLVCLCGSKNCKGKINCFSQLSDSEKNEVENLISKYLLK